MYTYQDYQESASYIQSKINGRTPKILLALGSGLGSVADIIEDPIVIPYGEIPNFKTCSVESHAGELLVGTIHGTCVMLLNGRFHIYEGYNADDIIYPIRVAKLLGIDNAVFTNAAGGINLSYRAGDIVVISDYIQFNMKNPLFGANLSEFGPRFPESTKVYDKELRDRFMKIAQSHGDTRVFEGVYFYASGPQFETPAEIRAMRILGGDVVGMSTVAESMAASHMEMKVLGVSVITNMASGVTTEVPWDIYETARVASKRLGQYIIEFINTVE